MLKNVLKKTVIVIVCCALVINTLESAVPVIVNAATTDESTSNAVTSKCMKITSKEYVYNATKGFRTFYADSYTSATHSFIKGRAVETDKTYGTAAIVVHVPEAFEGAASMELNVQLQRRYGSASTSSTSKHKFRVVKNDEIIYPTDGTWADVSGAWSGVTISGVSFEAQAGDDIYFILYDSAKKSNYANFYVDADMTIDSVTFDSSALDYSTSDPTSESYTGNTTTSDFFGGTYKRSELITYEYITKWFDYDAAETDLTFDNFDKKDVSTSKLELAMNANSGNNRQWLSWGAEGNWEGAEYFVANVSNPSESDTAGLKFEFFENNSPGYGLRWYVGHYTDYYLFGTDGIRMKMETTAAGTNCGQVNIPAGFSGQLIIPITSFEVVGYMLPQDSTYADWYGRYGEPNVVHLDKFAFFDCFYLTSNTSSTDTFTIDGFEVWGSYIPSVSGTYKRVIQAIDDIGVVTVASESQIVFAKELYEELSDTDKELVTNYTELETAISAFASLSDYNGYVGTKGKDFTGTEGITMAEILSISPSTVSAWIKVSKDISDTTHVGTVIGNMERTGTSQYVVDASRTMSMEITTNGNPKFTWKISNDKKVTFVVSNVDVRTSEWLNLSFVRDTAKAAVYCYVNGVCVATKSVSTTDIADITFAKKPLLIGSDYTNDAIMAPSYTPDFNGMIANVCMYEEALTAEQITTSLTAEVSDVNLIHDIDLYEGENSYYDRVTKAESKVAAGWIDNGAELLAEGDYSIAILGDTQMMLSRAEDASGNTLYSSAYDETSNVFYKNVQWLIANKEKLNLQFVMHVGDLTDNGNNTTTSAYTDAEGTEITRYKYAWEYEYGLKWLNQLRSAEIPYALARGNHETSANFQEYYTATANSAYVASDVAVTDADGNETTVSGMMDSESMLNVAYTFEVNNQKYLIVTLDLEPSDEALTWANSVVSAHPDHRTIILTHAYQNAYGTRLQSSTLGGTNYGELVWTNLASQHANIIMVVSGHSSGTDIVRTTDVGVNGNVVHQVMIDESILEYYGKSQTGVFALMTFTNGGNTIAFNYYSPTEDKLFRSSNQFTIQLDENLFDDADDFDASDYATQDELPDMPIPTTSAYTYQKSSGDWWTSTASSAGEFAHNGMTLRSYFMTSVAYNIEEDGIFYFADTAYLNKSNQLRIKVYVTDHETMAKQVFPKDGSEYYTGSSNVYYYLNNVGGIEVKAGNSVVVAFTTTGGNVWAAGKFTGSVVHGGETVQSFTMTAGSAAYGNATAKQECDGVFEGTKTDYSIGYTDIRTTQSSTLTIKNTDGTVLRSIKIAQSGPYTYYMPELEKAGKVFVGYQVGSALYPSQCAYHYDAESLTMTAVFIDFAMFNSASVRMVEPVGLRFSTQIESEQYQSLVDDGAKITLGTLIAEASSITGDDGELDYSSLTTSSTFKKLNVVSTIQKTAKNGYVQFNAAVVGLDEDEYSDKFVGRAYMTVTYADESTRTLYALVADNARSVSEVAQKALADVSALYSLDYPYMVTGGYSPYSDERRSQLETFISSGTQQ